MALPSTVPSRRALAPAGLGNLSAHFADNDDQVDATDTIYYKRHALDTLPARLPNNPSPADVVYQHIHDLRMLDSNPRLNMASFVTTWMEEPARKLMEETINVNAADASIYPSCTMVEHKCVRLLADLFHAEKPDDTLGCATIGSTEAALLTGLNMKKWWQDKRKEKGLPYDKPNMIVCTSYQICWKKLAKYWDIEMRLGKFRDDSFVLRVEDVEQMVDENTIGIVGILGSTYTGHFDDIKALNDLCDKLRKERGLDIKVTVDGASGAMVAPFLFPKLVWDFQLPNVISIIVSGHKYGFVYPGIGWAIWRSKEVVHPDLIFHLNYLGTDQTNLTLNFSRPASQIVASYYQFLRLGRKGYTLLAASLQQLACYLADKLEATGAFRLLNDPRETVPLVSFTLKPYPPGELPYPHTGTEGTHSDVPVVRPYSEFEVVEKLKEYGWSVPAYKMAADADHIICCRIVIREDFSKSLADELLKAVDHALKWLDAHFAGRTRDDRDEMAERTKDIKPNKAPSKLDRMEKSHIVC